MPILDRFTLPGRVDDLAGERRDKLADAWRELLNAGFGEFEQFAQIYDPTVADTPADAVHHPVTWPAFPARRNRQATTPASRAALGDRSRDDQDEYCEWSVERDGDEIVAVTFTTEVPEYWSLLWDVDRDAVLALYHRHVSPDVTRADLGGDGSYLPDNTWNRRIDGPIMHLRQRNNTLGAAIRLSAEATELRERDGVLITDQQDFVACGGLGDPFRASDPQIAAAINGLAALGNQVTLADPIGLYIDRLETAGMRFPDGVVAADCWTVERGTPEHAVRARFALPTGRGPVSDVTVGGTPIASGAQLADRVVVRIEAISHSLGSANPVTVGCKGT